jgi:hypothetical protein
MYISSGHRLYRPFPFPGPPKFTQIGILGLKIYHLANLQVFPATYNGTSVGFTGFIFGFTGFI